MSKKESKDAEKSILISLRLTKGLKAKVDDLCEKRGVKRSELIRNLIARAK